MKIILVLAVAAALAAGGVYLGQTANPVESSLPDGALATVNGYPITESYVQRRIEQLPLGSQIEVREKTIIGYCQSPDFSADGRADLVGRL